MTATTLHLLQVDKDCEGDDEKEEREATSDVSHDGESQVHLRVGVVVGKAQQNAVACCVVAHAVNGLVAVEYSFTPVLGPHTKTHVK